MCIPVSGGRAFATGSGKAAADILLFTDLSYDIMHDGKAMHSAGAASARHVRKCCRWPICIIAPFDFKILSKQRMSATRFGCCATHIFA